MTGEPTATFSLAYGGRGEVEIGPLPLADAKALREALTTREECWWRLRLEDETYPQHGSRIRNEQWLWLPSVYQYSVEWSWPAGTAEAGEVQP